MKNIIRSKWTRLCGWLLALMGISTAHSCVMYGPIYPAVMYGCPHCDLEVSGKVVDSKGNPVGGIVVSRYCHEVKTASDGSFNYVDKSAAFPGDTLILNVRDVDGSACGSFESRTKTVNIEKLGEGDGSWYLGTYGKEGVEIEITSTDEK